MPRYSYNLEKKVYDYDDRLARKAGLTMPSLVKALLHRIYNQQKLTISASTKPSGTNELDTRDYTMAVDTTDPLNQEVLHFIRQCFWASPGGALQVRLSDVSQLVSDITGLEPSILNVRGLLSKAGYGYAGAGPFVNVSAFEECREVLARLRRRDGQRPKGNVWHEKLGRFLQGYRRSLHTPCEKLKRFLRAYRHLHTPRDTWLRDSRLGTTEFRLDRNGTLVFRGGVLHADRYGIISNRINTGHCPARAVRFVRVTAGRSLSALFARMPMLRKFDGRGLRVTKATHDLSFLFAGDDRLEKVANVSGWDTENVSNMKNLFSDDTSLYALSDLGRWDVENVSDLAFSFADCMELPKQLFRSIAGSWTFKSRPDLDNAFDLTGGYKHVKLIKAYQDDSVYKLEFR